jgi:hypothetical protein
MKTANRKKTKATPAGATRSKAKVTSKSASKSVHKAAPKSAARTPPKAAPKVAAKVVAKPVAKPAPPKVISKVVTKIVLDKPEAPASPGQPQPFRLAAIERTDPPMGAEGKNWYRYTITQGVNSIHGYLQGSANGVKHAAEQIVGQLNERRAGRWGYRTTRATAPAPSAS